MRSVSLRLRVLALLVVALLTAAGTLHGAGGARADGDPASDVLLGESVFYPYQPPVTAATTRALNAATAAAIKAHFNLKVALIASPVDLGVIPDLFGKPQEYAEFLDREITFQGTSQPLLVVMKDGYGVQGIPAAAAAAAAALPKPAGTTSEALAQAALAAVPKLAAAAGHPIGTVPASASTGGSGPNIALLVALVACAVIASGALIALRQRRGELR